ncbi:MAG: phage Gp37/Gp68 family protein, partial [Starkeya sp.]|nr:phage Gp37/Gp68 family protein [Starkeya sp.]
PGCTNCYAMGMAARLQAISDSWHKEGALHLTHYAGTTVRTKAGAAWSGKLMVAPEHVFTQPLHWRRPRRIFVNSMGDLFHEGHPEEAIDHAFAVMALAPQHTYMVLTKRSARMRDYVGTRAGDWMLHWPDAARKAGALLGDVAALGAVPFPLPNVWLGVSTEDQRRADERVPDLLATPAAIRFISAEPLLAPIDLTCVGNLTTVRAAMPSIVAREERGRPTSGNGSISGFQVEAIGRAGSSIEFFQTPDHMGGFSASSPRRYPRLDLVIAGGESGPKARPMHPDWARSLRDQCAAAGSAFFFKQWVEHITAAWAPSHIPISHAFDDGYQMIRVGKRAAGRRLDGVEHNAMPEARS